MSTLVEPKQVLARSGFIRKSKSLAAEAAGQTWICSWYSSITYSSCFERCWMEAKVGLLLVDIRWVVKRQEY